MLIIKTLLSLIQAVPQFGKWLERFYAYYTLWKNEQEKKKLEEAIKKAIKEHDQRPIESEAVSGKPSNKKGAVYRKSKYFK